MRTDNPRKFFREFIQSLFRAQDAVAISERPIYFFNAAEFPYAFVRIGDEEYKYEDTSHDLETDSTDRWALTVGFSADLASGSASPLQDACDNLVWVMRNTLKSAASRNDIDTHGEFPDGTSLQITEIIATNLDVGFNDENTKGEFTLSGTIFYGT